MHPRWQVTAEVEAAVSLWVGWRDWGSGPGPLPFAGGQADQPACLLAAFAILEAEWQRTAPTAGAAED